MSDSGHLASILAGNQEPSNAGSDWWKAVVEQELPAPVAPLSPATTPSATRAPAPTFATADGQPPEFLHLVQAMFRKYYFNKTKAEWAFKTEVIAWLESRKKTNGEKITHHEALAIFAVGAPIEAKKGGAPSKERKKRQKKSAKTASNN